MRCMPPSPVDTLETTVDGVLSRDSFCPSYAAGIIWKNCFRYLKRGKSRRLHPVAQRIFGAGPWYTFACDVLGSRVAGRAGARSRRPFRERSHAINGRGRGFVAEEAEMVQAFSQVEK